jgi:hypothetical protein
MLMSALIARARKDLKDTGSQFRWDDSTMLEYANEGRVEIAKLRIDAYCGSTLVTEYPGDVTLKEATGLQPYFETALRHYVCYRALIEDSEHQGNQATAAMFLNSYIAGLK